MVIDPCIFPDLPLPLVGLLYGPGLCGAAVVELDVDGWLGCPFDAGMGCNRCKTSG